MKDLGIRTVVILLIIVTAAMAKNTKQERSETSTVSWNTTEVEWSPFPPGDVLNNPWLREIRFCFDFCFSEEKLQGFRNFWPYLNELGDTEWNPTINNVDYYYYNRANSTAEEISQNQTLRARLYCYLDYFPLAGKESLQCLHFVDPMDMLRQNIPVSVLCAVLASCSFLFGILGNILIISTIFTKKELRTSTNVLLAALAGANCLNSVTLVFYTYPTTFLYTILDDALGQLGCNIFDCLRAISQYAALNLLVTLSFDKYFATICWPMKNESTLQKTTLNVFLNWLLAGGQLFLYIQIKVPKVDYEYHRFHCAYFKEDLLYGGFILYDLSLCVFLPLCIFLYNYSSLVRSLRSTIQRSQQATEASSVQTQAAMTSLKLIKVEIALVILYMTSKAPGSLLFVLDNLGPLPHYYRRGNLVGGTVDMLSGVTSCSNIIVYTVMSRQYRKAFKDILGHCCSEGPVADQEMGTPNANIENQA